MLNNIRVGSRLMLLSASLLLSLATGAQNRTIVVSGSVKFDYPDAKMQIIKQDGAVKSVVAEFDIDSNNNFRYEMEVKEAGVYTLDCKKWESRILLIT